MDCLTIKEVIKKYNNHLIYDGECPFCNKFVELMQLKHAMPLLTLHNGRTDNQLINALHSNNYDLNKGMILIYQNNIFYGDKCINKLSQLIKKNNFFNKIIYLCFRNQLLAKILYPILKAGRHLWLYIKKIPYIK